MPPLGIVEYCAVHRSHEPEATYCEIHHIIPQAWQVFWQPPKPWPNEGPSPDRPGVTLWDARTVAVCRTGHGNIHYWLVKVTHAIASAPGADPEQPVTWKTALNAIRRQELNAGRHSPNRLDVEYSMQALVRFAAAGGKVADLIAHSLWGEI